MTLRVSFRRVAALLALLGFAVLPTLAVAQQPPPAYEGTCPNGAPSEEQFCRFITRYNLEETPLPTVVGDFLGVTAPSQTRTIGLIIAIDDYPNMPGHNISAAKTDGDLLQKFLTDEQKFDEVIVLRNADASAENINYFLENYLVNHADDFHGADGQPKARLLVAYSGHGRPETNTTRAAFVLSAANDPNGSTGMYKMTDFTSDVSALAPHYFHVLTLVNACFGANVFPTGNTGVAATPNAPGSFIITAGSPKNEAQALLPQRGSLFFDLIVNGVTNGDVDTQSSQYYQTDEGGLVTATPQGNLTLTLPLVTYLSGAFFKINAVQRHANPQFVALSAPYFGAAQTGIAQGAFFFLSTKPANPQITTLSPYLKPLPVGSHVESAAIMPTLGQTAASSYIAQNAAGHFLAITGTARPAPVAPLSPQETTSNLTTRNGYADTPQTQLPFGPISSIKGRPDIKIFKSPAIYPVKGYDLSSADGVIDWKKFAASPKPRFIYARAVGWSGPDRTFADRWSHAAALGIDRGAYIKFDFCRTTAEQVTRLRKVAPPTLDSLPVAVELVTPTVDQPQGRKQIACYKSVGVTGARDRIIELAAEIRKQWIKTPLLLGNSYNLSVLTDARSDAYMIWLNAYGSQGSTSDKLKLQGRNPWTMWQYSGSLEVAGIGNKTTGEVFFGTTAQYEAFRQADVNVGLSSVM